MQASGLVSFAVFRVWAWGSEVFWSFCTVEGLGLITRALLGFWGMSTGFVFDVVSACEGFLGTENIGFYQVFGQEFKVFSRIAIVCYCSLYF